MCSMCYRVWSSRKKDIGNTYLHHIVSGPQTLELKLEKENKQESGYDNDA